MCILPPCIFIADGFNLKSFSCLQGDICLLLSKEGHIFFADIYPAGHGFGLGGFFHGPRSAPIKELHPEQKSVVLEYTNTDRLKICTQNVFPVPFRVHPSVHNIAGGCISCRNIFSNAGAPVANRKASAIVRTGVLIIDGTFCCPFHGGIQQNRVHCQRRYAGGSTFCVNAVQYIPRILVYSISRDAY